MRPYNRMRWSKLIVDIQRAAARGHDVVVAGFAGGLEDGLGASGGERFEKTLHGRGAAVVELVAGDPEGVAAGGGCGLHAEEGEVGRTIFEEACKMVSGFVSG